MKAFPTRTAAFIRALASDVAPLNRIDGVIRSLSDGDSESDDYTERERYLAEKLGPTDAELTAMLAWRGEELRKEIRRLKQECDDRAAYVRAHSETYDGMKLEIEALKKLLAAKETT